jgi:hypothetical protein
MVYYTNHYTGRTLLYDERTYSYFVHNIPFISRDALLLIKVLSRLHLLLLLSLFDGVLHTV